MLFQTKKPERYIYIYICQQICTIINVKGNPSGRRKVIPDGNMAYKNIRRAVEMVTTWINIYDFFPLCKSL